MANTVIFPGEENECPKIKIVQKSLYLSQILSRGDCIKASTPLGLQFAYIYSRFLKTWQRRQPPPIFRHKKQVMESPFSQASADIIIKASSQSWPFASKDDCRAEGEMKHCKCFEVFTMLVPVWCSRPSVFVGTAFDEWKEPIWMKRWWWKISFGISNPRF